MRTSHKYNIPRFYAGFGPYLSVGGTSANNQAPYISATLITLNQGGSPLTLSTYLQNVAGNCHMALYDSSGTGGNPGKLLSFTQDVTVSNGWTTLPITNVLKPILPGNSNYWIVRQLSNNNTFFSYQASSANNTLVYANLAYGAFPASFPTVGISNAQLYYSVFATFK